jgi:hypothetical protein
LARDTTVRESVYRVLALGCPGALNALGHAVLGFFT